MIKYRFKVVVKVVVRVVSSPILQLNNVMKTGNKNFDQLDAIFSIKHKIDWK